MRYMPIEKIVPGMAVGHDIYDSEGHLILAKHLILNAEYAERLDGWGIPGVYIDDEFTEDIEIEQVLRPEVKKRAVKMVRDLFLIEEGNAAAQEEVQKLVQDVVNDVINNGDVMCNMLDLKKYDDYTYFHSVNVAVLSAMIGSSCHLSAEELNILTTAAVLHDIGKRFVDINILNAQRALTEAERRIIIEHPKLGYDFLKDNYDFSANVYASVLQHHEWYNGEGYPLGRAGDEIPLYARIIKLADVYDALTSKRPYREALPPSEAVEYIMGAGGVEFDFNLIDLFVKKIVAYPVGCEVRLSDGRTAIVVKNYADFILRPCIKLIPTGEILDLKEDPDARCITITKLLI